MALKLTFYGGAETVTGSNFLVEGARGKLIVDCGIEQGRDFCESDMYASFPYDVPSLHAAVITHAHLDHIGRLPKLMKEGFKGRIYMTAPTKDLTQLILEDSARIMAQDARDKGLPLLYSEQDVHEAMGHIDIVEYHQEWEAAPGLSCYMRSTGHILGSGSVRIRDMEEGSDGVTLALTGDIGNSPSPYLTDPEPVTDADVMVMESVYGDRLHTHADERVEELLQALTKAIGKGGTILIPAFSLERTQIMLYEISNLMDAGKLPKIPVFLDSPLAIKATDVYAKWAGEFFRKDVQEELKREKDIFRFPMLTQTPTREESEKILETPAPKIIMAGAGMSHGGRIGRWEQKYLPDASTTLFIVGYQAPGSPGRLLQDGAKQIRLDGNPVPVRATIQSFSGWSAHADRDGLLAFAEASGPRVKTIFTALGEPSAARFLAQRIHGFLGKRAIVPEQGQVWEISKEGIKDISKRTT